MDTSLYTQYPYHGVYTCDDVNYNPDKPRFKDLLWNHYSWFVEMDRTGKARPCVLDNVQKVLLCNTMYLGYDVFECNHCDNGGDEYLSFVEHNMPFINYNRQS